MTLRLLSKLSNYFYKDPSKLLVVKVNEENSLFTYLYGYG